MSFLKLFATGKSLIGMKSHSSPYRMRTENLLPKFESPKNPFATISKTEPPVKIEPAVPQPIVKSEARPIEADLLFDQPVQPALVPAPAKAVVPEPVVAKVEKVETQPAIPVVAAVTAPKVAAPKMKTPMAKAATPRTSGPKQPLSAWMKKMNPLAYLPVHDASAVKARRPVQTELSLEKVKVVRNDLNDTDLEVVPARTAEKTEASTPKMQPMTGTEVTALSRLTSRFFGAGQPQV